MALRFLRENALSLAMFALFGLTVSGQIAAGYFVHDQDLVEAGASGVSLGAYLGSGAFAEAIFENWESEFLQMAVFVLLTRVLRQKGSSESKALEGSEDVDVDPRTKRDDPKAPWPVRRGGLVLRIYEHSLSAALLGAFLLSFAGHALGGARAYNEQQRLHSKPVLTTPQYVASSQFWFESLQNWQSEFLSMGVLIFLSIYLRERGSPQSKPVAAPHEETGD